MNNLKKEDVLKALRPSISHDNLERWFSSAAFDLLPDNRVQIRVPNLIHQLWIESNFLHIIKMAMTDLLGQPAEIVFDVLDQPLPDHVADKPEKMSSGISEITSATKTAPNGLSPRFTFDSYVVGPNSQMANAAAQAVVEKPGPTYNPLFLHGGTGLGKTHLMHAIGNAVLARKPNFKVCYTTSEAFFNEYVSAIQNNALPKFRKRFRGLDLLLIDDIHFLSGKDRTQEEFFHTFNTLYDGLKQIVLASDRPPSEIGQLEERLVSRFEWGMTAHLSAPDAETRLAILRSKLATMKVSLNDEVVQFIATRIRSNVRRLEGALLRVASHASFQGSSLSIASAENVLRDYIDAEARNRRAVTHDAIQKETADAFDIRLADMTSKARPARIALARQVAMYLTRQMTPCSLQEIGRAFGGRDHGTVLHACHTVTKKMEADASLKQLVTSLEIRLERGASA